MFGVVRTTFSAPAMIGGVACNVVGTAVGAPRVLGGAARQAVRYTTKTAFHTGKKATVVTFGCAANAVAWCLPNIPLLPHEKIDIALSLEDISLGEGLGPQDKDVTPELCWLNQRKQLLQDFSEIPTDPVQLYDQIAAVKAMMSECDTMLSQHTSLYVQEIRQQACDLLQVMYRQVNAMMPWKEYGYKKGMEAGIDQGHGQGYSQGTAEMQGLHQDLSTAKTALTVEKGKVSSLGTELGTTKRLLNTEVAHSSSLKQQNRETSQALLEQTTDERRELLTVRTRLETEVGNVRRVTAELAAANGLLITERACTSSLRQHNEEMSQALLDQTTRGDQELSTVTTQLATEAENVSHVTADLAAANRLLSTERAHTSSLMQQNDEMSQALLDQTTRGDQELSTVRTHLATEVENRRRVAADLAAANHLLTTERARTSSLVQQNTEMSQALHDQAVREQHTADDLKQERNALAAELTTNNQRHAAAVKIMEEAKEQLLQQLHGEGEQRQDLEDRNERLERDARQAQRELKGELEALRQQLLSSHCASSCAHLATRGGGWPTCHPRDGVGETMTS